MKLIWYGHSCFKLESADGTIVFDPYETGRVIGYSALPSELSADVVICSHEHRDHNAFNLVLPSKKKFNGVIKQIKSWHDDVGGAKRGENNIALVETEQMRVVHMGDIGCELDEKQLEELGEVDVLMIPVGGFYTVSPKIANDIAKKLNARIVLPMHYRFGNIGYKEIGTLDEFCLLRDKVIEYDTNFILIDKELACHTAVLKYIP